MSEFFKKIKLSDGSIKIVDDPNAIKKTGDQVIDGSLTVTEDISGNEISSTTNIIAGNNIEAGNDISASNDISAGHDLSVGNDATITNDLTVSGDTYLQDTNITGNLTVSANTTTDTLNITDTPAEANAIDNVLTRASNGDIKSRTADKLLEDIGGCSYSFDESTGTLGLKLGRQTA